MGDVVTWLESQSPENLESESLKLPVRFSRQHELTEAQLQILQQMAEMFANYSDSAMNLRVLKAIYYLMKNPDNEVDILSSKRIGKSLFMFEEKIPLADIVKSILYWVKNRVEDKSDKPPQYKTVLTDKQEEKDKTRFEMDPDDLHKVRLNFAKREKTSRSMPKINKLTAGKGRIIGNNRNACGKIAVMPTVMNALYGGSYSLLENRFSISSKDFVYPRYEENVVYNVMLILDTSSSISWVIPHIEKFISFISANVANSRDKLGLITFNDDLARIFHYPTLNVKQVIGSINKMEAKGQTPLGEGLNLAIQVLGREKYKQPGFKNLVILISDCFPEPLEGGHKDLMDEPSYKQVIAAAEKIRDEKLGFIIINPTADDKGNDNWGQKLIKKIVEITGAKLIDVPPVIKYNLLNSEKAFIAEEKLTELYSAVSEVKVNL